MVLAENPQYVTVLTGAYVSEGNCVAGQKLFFVTVKYLQHSVCVINTALWCYYVAVPLSRLC